MPSTIMEFHNSIGFKSIGSGIVNHVRANCFICGAGCAGSGETQSIKVTKTAKGWVNIETCKLIGAGL